MADTKLADLTALTTPSGDDLLYVVDDPAGTPADRKMALDNLFTRGTVTISSPVIDASQTWNAGATTFTAIKMNITDTASSASSLLMDLQVGESSRFRVGKNGNVTITNASVANAAGFTFSTSPQGYWLGSYAQAPFVVGGGTGTGGIVVRGDEGFYSFASSSSTNGTRDVILTRRAAANLRLGAADAAAPVAQTLSVQSVVAGTTNTAGANLTITGSQGTGTGAGGSIVFQVAPAGGTGSAQNALATALTINSNRTSSFDGSILPQSDNGADVGSAVNRWNSGWFATSLKLGINGSFDIHNDVRVFRDAANTLALRNGANAQTFRVYNTTDGTNSEFGKIAWSSNVLQIGTDKTGTGTARALEFQTGGTTRLTISAAGAVTFAGGINLGGSINLNGSTEATRRLFFNGVGVIKWPSDGVMLLHNDAQNDFGRLQFGGTTSSFPAIKRSSTTLQARLADDSAFASVQGKLTTDTAYTAGDPTTTGYLIIYDSNGTAYRVPAVAN